MSGAPSLRGWRGDLIRPWGFPSWAWVAPWRWWRLYLHVGDWLLFRAWWASRRVMWAVEDAVVAPGERLAR